MITNFLRWMNRLKLLKKTIVTFYKNEGPNQIHHIEVGAGLAINCFNIFTIC